MTVAISSILTRDFLPRCECECFLRISERKIASTMYDPLTNINHLQDQRKTDIGVVQQALVFCHFVKGDFELGSGSDLRLFLCGAYERCDT